MNFNVHVHALMLDGEDVPHPFLVTPFDEFGARFSPDAKWIAYSSNESGQVEVYVRPYPGPGGKWQASSAGGRFPRWSADGRRLFYFQNRSIYEGSVAVEGRALRIGCFRRTGCDSGSFKIRPRPLRLWLAKITRWCVSHFSGSTS